MQREEREMNTKNLRNPEYMKRWFDQVGFQAADEIDKYRKALQWIDVKDELPKHGNGNFLAYWKAQPHLMLVCFADIHGNYVIAGTSGDISGNGDYPKFSHWRPLPPPPKTT